MLVNIFRPKTTVCVYETEREHTLLFVTAFCVLIERLFTVTATQCSITFLQYLDSWNKQLDPARKCASVYLSQDD